ncbi:DUF4091 domain-containing protein [Paenibacillus hamazuiensis]|uniref:DUF4091 domain-containing protein n=1 Tax=Paenibacillus hamazuiensis TaxID=2936508 RepID=UPI00200CFD59|nr:DUF4091 domain-containing protein [Paenibacillus hamazuiensis]
MPIANVKQQFETRCISSLAKVFADEELRERPFRKASALANETYSFQVAYRSSRLLKSLTVEVESPLKRYITFRRVGLVPVELPIYGDHDENVLRSTPGLYPDPLYPIGPGQPAAALPYQWRSIWITVRLDGMAEPSVYPIRCTFSSDEGRIGEETFELTVLPAQLPRQRLIHTEWFHADCLSTCYREDAFSERHWELIENYVECCVRHGMNMILTPLFTLPLDTEVGGERPTLQLVDVEKSGQTYRFGFDKLQRWVELCDGCGIRYFEFSHLFTQWGAKHAPKIVALENGEPKRIFGWETDATGEEYAGFLAQFLPELVQFIKRHGLAGRSYFHVSDEPHKEHLAWYESASSLMDRHVGDFPIIDALSDFDYYERGLVRKPVAPTDRIGVFLENEVPELWAYYCCSQYKRVANRFICFPSARNRILGVQLYKHNIAGFLHWGFNFWFTQYSKYAVNPFQNTDSGFAFPAGDGFLVYPGADGKPIESLRLEVLYDALQDLRALELLESRIGRAATVELLEEGLERPITFTDYPADAEWLLDCRERINQAIYRSCAR